MYCPTTDKRFIMIDGELADPPEGDLETGSSFCGCCCPVQEPNTEDIALTVINEEEGEGEAELVEPPEEQDVGSIQIVQDITEELVSEVIAYEIVKTRIWKSV